LRSNHARGGSKTVIQQGFALEPPRRFEPRLLMNEFINIFRRRACDQVRSQICRLYPKNAYEFVLNRKSVRINGVQMDVFLE